MSTARNKKPTPSNFPALYRPAEVAKMLRCSEWWVKEQARNRKIPFSWIGGSYLFTEDHVHEIVRLFEERPGPRAVAPESPSGPTNVTQHRPPKTRLKARSPRRTLSGQSSDAA